MSKEDLLSAPGDIVIQSLDARTQSALAQMVQDSDLFHQFVHGADTATVDTEGGTVDSVAKIAKELRAWRFLQLIVDAATLIDAQALTSSEVAVGGLVRIYDDGANTGIWQTLTVEPTTLTKITYQDLIDMAALPENTSDYTLIHVSGPITGTAAAPDDTYFAKVAIAESATTSTVQLDVDYIFNNEEAGGIGSINAKHTITLMGQSNTTHDETSTEEVIHSMGGLAALSCGIDISYQYNVIDAQHEWAIRIIPPDAWQVGSAEVWVKTRQTANVSAMAFGDTF